MRAGSFKDCRQWVAANGDVDAQTSFRAMYDHFRETMTDDSVANMVRLIADYSYRSGQVADQEINTIACVTEMMVSCKWK